MIGGRLLIDGYVSMNRLVTLLTENDYTVQVKQIEGFDAFDRQFEIKYKRAEDEDEE